MKTLAETICELSREHCQAGGLIMGQNLEAVQNVCGTVPIDEPNVQVMPTCESAGIGMAIGAALSGRPVIHVVRFASFLMLQAGPLAFYAARAKSEWGYELPLFIRVSSDDGIGPTHSGVFHSPFIHLPGLKVVAPMTSGEYRDVWREFRETKQPVLVSEHRQSYSNLFEMPHLANSRKIDVTIVAMSAARFAANDALEILSEKGIGAEVIHLYNLWDGYNSPLDWSKVCRAALDSLRVLIVDSSYEQCSFMEHVGLTICRSLPELKVELLGMKTPPGVYENGSPSAQDIADAADAMV